MGIGYTTQWWSNIKSTQGNFYNCYSTSKFHTMWYRYSHVGDTYIGINISIFILIAVFICYKLKFEIHIEMNY